MELRPLALVADVAVEPADGRGRQGPPAVVVRQFQPQVGAGVSVTDAQFGGILDPAEGSPGHVALEAAKGEAVLHAHVDRPAERIQPEHRIVGDHLEPVDGHGRDEVPAHVVAEGLVDPHPVLVDGQALGHPGHGRGDEAAKLEVRLKVVAGLAAQGHAGDPLQQHLGQVLRPLAGDVGRGEALHAGGDVGGVGFRRSQRRARDHHHLADHGAAARGRPMLLSERRRRGHGEAQAHPGRVGRLQHVRSDDTRDGRFARTAPERTGRISSRR